MKEAEANAQANFRRVQGDPALTGDGRKYPWNCAFDSNATAYCTSYNLKKDHPASSIVNGKCKYLHHCDKFTGGTEADGSKAKCNSAAHPRVDCKKGA